MGKGYLGPGRVVLGFEPFLFEDFLRRVPLPFLSEILRFAGGVLEGAGRLRLWGVGP